MAMVNKMWLYSKNYSSKDKNVEALDTALPIILLQDSPDDTTNTINEIIKRP